MYDRILIVRFKNSWIEEKKKHKRVYTKNVPTIILGSRIIIIFFFLFCIF